MSLISIKKQPPLRTITFNFIIKEDCKSNIKDFLIILNSAVNIVKRRQGLRSPKRSSALHS